MTETNSMRTVFQAADDWGVSPSLVRQWCQSGAIASHKVGRDWVVTAKNPAQRKDARGRKRGG